MDIKKAVIPAAGWATRFLPLSKVLAKPLLPVADLPMIHYIVREAKEAGFEEIIFVLNDNVKNIGDYFARNEKLENVLVQRRQDDWLEVLSAITKEFAAMRFSVVCQPVPRGDGDAILKAKAKIAKEPFIVLFSDDIFLGREAAAGQLARVFQTSQRPVLGLKRIPKEKFALYGMAEVEKIASRLYKIKKIVEKPKKPEDAPSDLSFCGRWILTPDIFDYLAKAQPTAKGEIILANGLNEMLRDGQTIYGYELENEWLECGNMADWMKTNLRMCLEHQKYGAMIREWVKKMK
ncbi:MAG: sugar phosphate nucleotidyltransferase [Patescibacteria group bacterium]|nr:sugar phosphate nucleotidyltransferase [Patescibacteria group bacterium]